MNEPYIHPCETLKELLKNRRIKAKHLAIKTGYNIDYVKRLLKGEASITKGFAYALERVFGISQNFFIRLQENYDKEREQNETKRN